MADKIKVPLLFSNGINTKADPKTMKGKLLSLTNGFFQTTDEIRKRYGYTAFTLNILGGGTISNGIGLGTFQNQITLADGQSLYSYNDSVNAWSNKGPLVATTLESTSILKNLYSQTSPDFAYNSASGISTYVWEDTQGGIRYSVIDDLTGNQIVDDALLSSTGINPRIATIGTVFILFYVVSGQIKFNTISTTTPETLSGVTALTSDLNTTNQIYDVTVSNSKIFIGYNTSSPSIGFYSINTSLTISSQYTVGSDVETCISLTSDVSNNIWASYYTGTAVKTCIVNNALGSTVLAATTVETVSSIRNIASVVNGTTGTLFYEVQTTAVYNENIRTNTITLSGTAGTATVFIRSLGIASKAFNFNSGIYLVGTYSSNLQGKYFLLNQNAQVVCRFGGEPNLGGGLTAKSLLPSIWNVSSGVYQLPFLLVDEITFSQVTNVDDVVSEQASTQTGIQQAQISFSLSSPLSLSLGNNLNIQNGIPSLYDSNNVAEQGFNLYPENSSGGAVASNFIGSGFDQANAAQYSSGSPVEQSFSNDILAANPGWAIAQPFSPSESGPLISVTLQLAKHVNIGGGITGNIDVAIWTNSAGVPGTLLSNTSTVPITSVTGQDSFNILTIAFTSGSVVAGTNYFIVIDAYSLSFSSSGGQVFAGSNTASVLYNYCLISPNYGVDAGQWVVATNALYSPSTGYFSYVANNNNLVFELLVAVAQPEVVVAYNPLGGALTPGEYQYLSLYSWVDNEGQKHQSAAISPFTSDSTKNLGQYHLQIVASISSSSTSATTSDTFGLFPGIGLSGADITASPPTTIASVTSGNFVMNQNGSLTNTTALVTGVPKFQVTAITNIGSNVVTIDAPEFMYIYGTSQGTDVVLFDDTSGLQVGMSLTAADGDSSFPTSQIVSVQTGSVTLNQAVGTIVGQALQISIQFQGVTTTGSSVVTGVPSSIFPLLISSGNQTIESLGFTGGGQYFISSFNSGANTITIGPGPSLASSGTYTVYVNLNVASFLSVGQELSDNAVNIAVDSLITGVQGNPNGTATVELSEDAIGSTTGNSASIINTIMGVIQIPTLRVTNRTGPINIDIYRTTNIGGAPGTIFFKAGSILNNTSVDFVTFLDKISDQQILSNEQLYTTGGVVQNIAAPPHQISVKYNNRQLVFPNENGLSFWYSQQVVPGSPVEFSDSFINNIDSEGGDVTAAAVMDDKLIMFKETVPFYIVGQGPSPNGANNDYTSGQQIMADTGCANQDSLVKTPIGLMFQSPKGIYLMSRDLETLYIGADVEAYNGDTVTSAQLLEGVNQVRFTLNTGVSLMYDYYFKQWSVFTNISAIASVNFQGQFTYLNSSGLVLTESPGTFTDNGSFIQRSLTTAWLSFGDVQGFQRAYEMLILGQYESPHNLVVSVAYNFNSTPTQTDIIPVTQTITPYQFRVFFQIQKCEAFQITISDTQTAPYGEGMSLSGLLFEVGVKRGAYKMPAVQSFG